jgi:hypothetical protein
MKDHGADGGPVQRDTHSENSKGESLTLAQYRAFPLFACDPLATVVAITVWNWRLMLHCRVNAQMLAH